MSSKKEKIYIYRTLSSIYKIVGAWDSNMLDAFNEHIKATYLEPERSALSSILMQLNKLTHSKFEERQQETSSDKDLNQGYLPFEKSKTTDEQSGKWDWDRDSINFEITAMLNDSSFFNKKSDIVNLIKRYLANEVNIRAGNKDSLQDLIKKVTSAFNKMEKAKQLYIYNSLRRAYLKDRKSDLGEWSEIITNGND